MININLSAVIITENNEDTIRKCLESIKEIEDIVIVDSFSRDRTVEIAKKYTDRIYFRKWKNFVDQRDYALPLAKHDWVLFLDSDEVLDKDLFREICHAPAGGGEYTGYKVKIVTFFLGRELKYVDKPAYILRLFRRSKSYLPRNMFDDTYKTENAGRIDKGIIYHFTSNTIRRRIVKIMRHSGLFAYDYYKTDRARWWFIKTIYWPVRSFFGNYFINKGFKDGWRGLIWCILKATQHFLAYSKIGLKIIKQYIEKYINK